MTAICAARSRVRTVPHGIEPPPEVGADEVALVRERYRLGDLPRAADAYAAAAGADVLVVLTEWPEFAELRLDSIAGVLRGSTIVDARNVLSPDGVRAAGLAYVGVGRR